MFKFYHKFKNFFIIIKKLFLYILYLPNASFTKIYRYNSMWYVAPLRVQKLILFLLQHGTKNFTIILGGFFVSSLEGFATVISVDNII